MDNGNVNVYINGVLRQSTTSPNGYRTTAADVIFGRGFVLDPGRWFSGQIPVFKLYTNTLTADEVRANFDSYKGIYEMENVITSGSLVIVDAGNPLSYPGSGTTWTNIAGGNNGTLNGSPTYNTIGGGALQFNGPSSFDYVAISDTITHKTGQNFSYECWVYFNGLSGYDKTIVGKPGCNIGLMQAGSSMGMAVFGPNGVCAGGNTQYYAAGTANTGVWEHWIGTYEVGVGIKTFKNGTLVSSVPVTGNIGNWGDTLYIGGSINSNYTGECYIAYTSTYSITLNQNQITQNFNALRSRFGV